LQISSLQGLTNLPVLLVIFGAVAVFLILRLRSVLGKRIGFEKPPIPSGQMQGFGTGPIIEGQAQPAANGHQVPDPRSALGERLMQIVNRDVNFDPPKFLSGAETAFRMIVTSFAAGDRPTLKTLLTDGVYQTFDAAIAAREAAGERHRTEIKSILSAVIEDAQLLGDLAAVIVRFTSDQVNLVLDATGQPAQGASEAITEIADVWTFERNLKSKDLTWRLASARSG
jgi:predicted lipid-binding transport protein (Tim44 family)